MPTLPDERYQLGRIVARTDFTPELWSIRVGTAEPFEFRPGQYATLGIELEGRVLERPYSIVSAPEEPELEFFIEMIPGGALTPHLHRLSEGQEILLRRRPKGLFLRQGLDAERAHLFVATVTGIAPFASILRRLRAAWPTHLRILLLQGASHPDEFGYRDEMERLELEVPGFQYVPTVSRPWTAVDWRGEVGRAEDVLRKHADLFGITPEEGRVYLCGHPGMISGGRAVMRRRGLQDREILEEQYWPDGKEPNGAAP
ncbi:MAG: FAD-binding oxidoreductase [Candidatus Dormiibacterota bacterium]